MWRLCSLCRRESRGSDVTSSRHLCSHFVVAVFWKLCHSVSDRWLGAMQCHMFGFTELTNFCCESYVTMVTKLALQVVFFFFRITDNRACSAKWRPANWNDDLQQNCPADRPALILLALLLGFIETGPSTNPFRVWFLKPLAFAKNSQQSIFFNSCVNYFRVKFSRW